MHREAAKKFYPTLAAAGQKVRVGMEASEWVAGSNGCWQSCGSHLASSDSPEVGL
jgi:hypothetical protein